ncbi:MAG: hypothetical protein AAF483_24900 [Planctomycetota bacterium]
MSEFRFQFEALLRTAQLKRDHATQELRQLEVAMQHLALSKEQLVAKRDAPQLFTHPAEYRRATSRIIDASRIAEIEQFRTNVQREIDATELQRKEKAAAILQQRRLLAGREQRVEMLRELKALKKKQWQKRQSQQEQARIDELAGLVRFRWVPESA